jgi:hypothetical protein
MLNNGPRHAGRFAFVGRVTFCSPSVTPETSPVIFLCPNLRRCRTHTRQRSPPTIVREILE